MPRRLKVNDINPHFVCTICDGYLVDATTIIECLHSFCRTCIVRYLESSKFCPVCDVQVHKTRPLLSIRSDQTLQDLVYKMVPGLYQNEMQRRREFYVEHPKAAAVCPPGERGECDPRFFSPRESISITVQHRSKDMPNPTDISDTKDPMTRYLNCPAAFTISHLKKFISLKFSLPHSCAVDIFYDDHLLRDDYSLMDIAYIYSWKRAAPMKFFYSITKCVLKCLEPPPPPPPTDSVHVSSIDSVDTMECAAAAVDAPDSETVTATAEPQVMEVDQEILISDETDKIPTSEAAKTEPPETVPVLSSMNNVQKIDLLEQEVINTTSSLLDKPSPVPIAEPTYNSVKVVSTPERNTVLSPTNGFRLKFIHDPELNPKSRSKKSGRKGGRSSRHKSIPVRLARLAPYPPPPPPPVPATCLTTQPLQHLSQITMGKLVPSVIPTLTPTIVTTLVSTTPSTLCNATHDSNIPQVTSFINQPTTVGNISANVANFVSSVSSSMPENNKALSSTSNACSHHLNGLTVTSTPSQSPDEESPTSTKELPNNKLTLPPVSANTTSLSSPKPTASPISVYSLSVSNDSIKIDPTSTSLSSSSLSSSSISMCIPDNMNFSNATSTTSCNSENSLTVSHILPVASCSSKETENIETVTSTSVEILSASIVPSNTDSNSRSALKEQSSIETTSSNFVNHESSNALSNDKEITVKSPVDKKSESFKMSVKNSISAEFSDNDDLGCQPDLVVDEQKMDSSDNEDDTDDAALRKKITAIAEKDDEAEVTDDTEADSGRASDLSCPARCEDDIDSPMISETSISLGTTVSIASTPATTSSTEENHRHVKANNIDVVINNLKRLQEISRPASSAVPSKSVPPPLPPPPPPPKDDIGVLDLSTCTRKPGDVQISRPKAVANPVLDIKHRQQSYLPAPQPPLKQHTVCTPAPKHTPSSYLMQQQMTAHSNSILHAQLTGNAKSSTHPMTYSTSNVSFTTNNRPTSSPSSLAGRTTPAIYGHKLSPGIAHQSGINLLPAMLSYPNSMMSPPYSGRSNMTISLPLPSRSLPNNSFQKDISLSTSGANTSQSFNCHSKGTAIFSTRKPSDAVLTNSPNCRGSNLSSSAVPAHPRTSPSMLRMSPHHRSASPAPSPQHVTPANSLAASSLAAATTPSQSKPCVPMYKKADSFKGYNHKFKSSNLAVFNPDPNGFKQKLVIKKMDSRQNSHH